VSAIGEKNIGEQFASQKEVGLFILADTMAGAAPKALIGSIAAGMGSELRHAAIRARNAPPMHHVTENDHVDRPDTRIARITHAELVVTTPKPWSILIQTKRRA
jgi:hypothetical protein